MSGQSVWAALCGARTSAPIERAHCSGSRASVVHLFRLTAPTLYHIQTVLTCGAVQRATLSGMRSR